MHDASLLQPERPADGRATEFTAVDGTGEQYSGYALLVEAYAAVWVILMAWIFLLWRKQAGLSARIAGLESAIDRAERRATTAPGARRETSSARPEPGA